MRHFLKIVCFCMFWGIQFSGKGQCLLVDGILTDVNTKKTVLGASFWISNGTKRISVGRTTTGSFELAMPCDAKKLIVEAEGYRSFSITLNIDPDKNDKMHWLLPILLVPMDQQTSDKPYSQQEQTFYEMTDSTKKGTPFAIRDFVIIDAIKNTPISATVCLFYTKNQKKDCFEVSKTQHKEVNFQDKDIVALEVKSEGYQPFNGNLIVDKLDGRKSLYEIKLSQELNVISLSMNETSKPVYMIIESTGKNVEIKKGLNNRFYAFLSLSENYQVKVLSDRRYILFEDKLSIKKGFNTRFITIKIPETQSTNITISPTSPPVIPKPESLIEYSTPITIIKEKYTLLFDQSDFKLRSESQKILDDLGQLLLQHQKPFVRIVGYSDNTGNATQNKRLSELRTMVVKNYLSAKGIEDQRFFILGLGSKNAISPNDVEENKAKNRRVEIQLIE